MKGSAGGGGGGGAAPAAQEEEPRTKPNANGLSEAVTADPGLWSSKGSSVGRGLLARKLWE